MSYDLLPDIPRLYEAVQKAPSVFNTQPWQFGYQPPDRIELWLPAQGEDGDKARAKARAREYVISCGAALFNLRLAIWVAGHDCVSWLLPVPRYADVIKPPALLARVEIVTARTKKPAIWEQELYEAIWRRHTNRWPYRIIPAPLPIITAMERAAAQEGAYLRLLPPREARRWMRRASEVDRDPNFTPPFPNFVSRANYGPAPKERFPVIWKDRPITRKDFWEDNTRRFERKPQLMVLSTDDDQPVDWLRAGQALERALLTGTRYSVSAPDDSVSAPDGSESTPYGLAARYNAPHRYGVPAQRRLLRPDQLARYGLSASFLTQPLEYDDVKDEPRQWPWPWWWPWPQWRRAELPQMVMRVGYAAVPAPDEQRLGITNVWSQLPQQPSQRTLPIPGPGGRGLT